MHLIHCPIETVVELNLCTDHLYYTSFAQYTGMDLLNKLCSKKNLDTSDARTLLRYIQEASTPFLSVHTTSRVPSDARECKYRLHTSGTASLWHMTPAVVAINISILNGDSSVNNRCYIYQLHVSVPT